VPRRRRRRQRTLTPAHLRRYLLAGEPWQGPVPGVSQVPHLTELLTGHDFFGNGFGDRDDLRRRYWDALREDALRLHTEHGGDRLPWAHRRYDLDDPAAVLPGERPPGAPTTTVGGVTYWLDEHAVDRVTTFFAAFLRVTEGPAAGEPMRLLRWQVDELIRPVYGWRRPDGRRRTRDVYVEIPKKNRKSSTTAALALFHLLADGTHGAKVYALASSRDNARILFDFAKAMARAPGLARYCRPLTHRIESVHNDGRMEVLSALPAGKHGFNATCLIFDELHDQPNRKLWDVLNGATAATVIALGWWLRQEPQLTSQYDEGAELTLI